MSAAPQGLLPTDLGQRLEHVHEQVGELWGLRPAAVIGLLLEGPRWRDEPSLLLIKRSSKLRQHPGQLAFPGGKPEPGDRDLLDTALREAWEEVGLVREHVRVLGRLTPVPTPTGYMIVPFIGRVTVDWEPRRTSSEVEGILTPSLRSLLDPAIHRQVGDVEWQGGTYTMHEFAVADPPLWGATAGMVWDLLERIRG